MDVIHKTPHDFRVRPNLADYESPRARFRWSDVPALCEGMGHGRCNIAYAAVDRQAAGHAATRAALRFVTDRSWDGAGTTRDLSYAELGRLAKRFSSALRSLGIGRGNRVFTIMGRSPELYIAMMGALRNGSVVSRLFSAFGPEPIATRVNIGQADVLVTTKAIYQRKIGKIRYRLPSVRHVFIVDDDAGGNPPGTLNFWHWLNAADKDAPIEPTSPDDPALLHFTSGTTGTPKGAIHVHGAVTMHYVTGLYALDLHADDIYWCTADPGWATGASYGIVSPLLHGVTSIVDEADFDAERWYRILQDQGVSVWYTAPTAIRMLIKAGPELPAHYSFPRLRFVASVGEPLNPEAVRWGKRVLGLPIHDNWWQTETGGIMIANTPAFDIKPGSMGRPLPGVDACIVHHNDDGSTEVVDEDLRLELLGHARKRLGATVAPKEIEFVDSLPHTSSGKIMRRLLKARELGLPEGDTSTIEQRPVQHAEGVPS